MCTTSRQVRSFDHLRGTWGWLCRGRARLGIKWFQWAAENDGYNRGAVGTNLETIWRLGTSTGNTNRNGQIHGVSCKFSHEPPLWLLVCHHPCSLKVGMTERGLHNIDQMCLDNSETVGLYWRDIGFYHINTGLHSGVLWDNIKSLCTMIVYDYQLYSIPSLHIRRVNPIQGMIILEPKSVEDRHLLWSSHLLWSFSPTGLDDESKKPRAWPQKDSNTVCISTWTEDVQLRIFRPLVWWLFHWFTRPLWLFHKIWGYGLCGLGPCGMWTPQRPCSGTMVQGTHWEVWSTWIHMRFDFTTPVNINLSKIWLVNWIPFLEYVFIFNVNQEWKDICNQFRWRKHMGHAPWTGHFVQVSGAEQLESSLLVRHCSLLQFIAGH